ncbi:Tricarboxylate transport protein [Trichoderma simmonsii]|uniref:Tricarboxylate transport protein n=1 Tax=Trichoderma simmonsii TaxID=1491479 RepID=A0A8G0LBK6_9HYPO|nr:Tricarboxylate transport protein [Trichoderma simmonsii]
MCVCAAAVLNETGEKFSYIPITRKLTRYMCSRKDKVAAQQTASRGQEAAMATLRSAVVCGMHHAHHRQLCQGGNPYAIITQLAIWICGYKVLTWVAGFVAFDQFKSMLADENGKLSGPRTVLAGFGAGVTESLLAVTPTESIKTTLIDDRKSAKPRMRGFLHAVPIIARERGIRGFFQGFVPTTARQAANSATRFGAYNFFKQIAESYTAPGEKLGTVGTFAMGGLAGLVTVYVTQPLDTVKTRMQSIEARTQYGNTFRCAAMIFKQEGILTFWSGALPRLARLVLSGGIVFTMYEKSMDLMNKLDPEMKYI